MRPLRATGLVGLGMIAGFALATVALKRVFPSRGDEESDELALAAIGSGIELRNRARAFRGGSMITWFGGIAVDLREAELAPDARLSLGTVLGGIALRIPEGWRVESDLKALAGGVDVNVPEPAAADAPVLFIDGIALLGGIAVKAAPREAAAEATA
jgi:hypothetical protein